MDDSNGSNIANVINIVYVFNIFNIFNVTNDYLVVSPHLGIKFISNRQKANVDRFDDNNNDETGSVVLCGAAE